MATNLPPLPSQVPSRTPPPPPFLVSIARLPLGWGPFSTLALCPLTPPYARLTYTPPTCAASALPIWEKRIHFAADGNILHPVAVEDAGQHAPARSMHGVNGQLEVGLGNFLQAGELADHFHVRGLQIHALNFRGHAFGRGSRVQ